MRLEAQDLINYYTAVDFLCFLNRLYSHLNTSFFDYKNMSKDNEIVPIVLNSQDAQTGKVFIHKNLFSESNWRREKQHRFQFACHSRAFKPISIQYQRKQSQYKYSGDFCINFAFSLLIYNKQMINGRNVAYFHNEQIGKFYYYKDHPMKPKRMAMTHSLIESFDVYRKLDVYRARKADKQELLRFHHPEYINYLENYVCKDVLTSHGFAYTNDMMLKSEEERKFLINSNKLKSQFSMNETGDCPGFAGLYEFCQLSCGGSIDAAQLLLRGDAGIAVNWGGGLHHAKKCEASGFCYTNDIVLAILEMLKYYPRVLYLDVDVHHGDGVEEAFYLTDRVMTVSFHQYGEDFFPGTGSIDSVGEGKGKYYSVNVPLKVGIDDDTYQELFKTVMDEVMAKFMPSAVVLQLGGDSIAYDVLGRLNLSIKGHGECVKKMMSYGVPLMLLGGGGYTVHNVARLWAYETGLAVGQELDGYIPKTDRFYDAYQPDSKLHFTVKPTKNKNTPEYLNEVREKTFEHLRLLETSPGVPFHNVPPSAFAPENIMESEDKYLSSLLSKRDDMDI